MNAFRVKKMRERWERREKLTNSEVESVFNREKVTDTLLEGSHHPLNWADSQYLSLISSKNWSDIGSNEKGLHIRVELGAEPFVRLDRLSQRQLAKNVKKMLSCHMNALARIYKKTKLTQYFAKWRSTVVTKMSHFYFRYKSSLRHVFLMWKTYARSRRLVSRSKRQGCIDLACFIWRLNSEKLKRAFKQWHITAKGLSRLVRHVFDEWSLWTLRNKLRKCNVLKVFKILSARKAHRNSKRIRWYFNHWREAAEAMSEMLILQKSFRR